MLVLGIALSVVVGVVLGMLGGGGSILSLPILLYVVGLPPHEAIATSLLMVSLTSVAALVPHARAGRVRGRIGLAFGAAAMVGAFAAGQLAASIPAPVLLGAFGVMMLGAAAAMMRPRAPAASAPALPAQREPSLGKAALIGVVVGAVTSLVGAGGGFLVVPALVLLGGLRMDVAVGTSLMVIALSSAAGFAGHVGRTPIDLGVAAAVTGASVLGSLLGGRLAGAARPESLRRAFAWLVLATAVFVLGQQGPELLGVPPGRALPYALGAALVVLAVGVALQSPRLSLAALGRRRKDPAS